MLPFPPPGDLPHPGIKLASLVSPALQTDSLPPELPGESVKNPSLVVKITYLYTNFLEKAMAPHSSTLAWKIPWMEEPGML